MTHHTLIRALVAEIRRLRAEAGDDEYHTMERRADDARRQAQHAARDLERSLSSASEFEASRVIANLRRLG